MEQLDGEQRQAGGVGGDAARDAVERHVVVGRERPAGQRTQRLDGERPQTEGDAPQLAADMGA